MGVSTTVAPFYTPVIVGAVVVVVVGVAGPGTPPNASAPAETTGLERSPAVPSTGEHRASVSEL